MSKTSGLGDNLYVGGYDLSGDIGSLSGVSGPRGTLDVTGIDKTANERIYSTKDGAIGFSAFFNPATSQEHPVLAALPTADVQVMYCRGTSYGSDAAVMVAKQINYDGTRGNDGAFTFDVSAQANSYGLEWGTLMTSGKRTDASATVAASATASDYGAASTNGFQAYIQVFSLTSGTPTVKFQSSSDDAVADAYADVSGGSFGTVTANTASRIAVTGSIERYLKVVTTGTFSNLVFAVVLVRNDTAVVF